MFYKLFEILESFNNSDLDLSLSNFEGIYISVLKILKDIKCSNYYSEEDFISLIRNILCFQSYKEKDKVLLKVPKLGNFPSKKLWESFNIEIYEETSDFYKIRSCDWNCSWLNTNKSEFFDDVYSSKERRPKLEVRSDIAYQNLTGYTTYSSLGQREAIRRVIFMENSSSVIINLPTGTGKSMVGFINSLINTNYLTVFIVPTVSLALDQQRQYRKLLNDNNSIFAWHSGLTNDKKKYIKENIKNDRQRIVFTSPEAVCSSLSQCLIDAAKRKTLRYFVIDECHLVSQWGDNFRPEFQAIAGIRKLFLEHSPELKTILMSATITDETLRTIETIFELENPPKIISSVFLRGEPQYWVHKVESEEEKKRKILELIKFGARPYILYLNRPDEAKEWLKILRNEGYKRVETFHGDTKFQDRIRIIESWNNDDIDGIVATSAFGVGMDKNNIRMIIHACVPESLDRFYQEVGRSGRDGKSSISILVYTPKDYCEAEGLSLPRIITNELGLSRWNRMLSEAKNISNRDGLISIDLSVLPKNIKKPSKENLAWNLRTILLLVRAGFIQLDLEELPNINERLDEVQKLEIIEEHFNKVFLRIKNPNHANEKEWETKIDPERKNSYERAIKNFQLLSDYINNKLEISDALLYLYSIKRDNIQVPVDKTCGGCIRCLKENRIWSSPSPITPSLEMKYDIYENFLNISWLKTTEPIFINHNLDLTNKKNQDRLINRFLSQLLKKIHIKEIISPQKIDWLESNSRLLNSTSEKFLIFSTFEEYSFEDSFFQLEEKSFPIITILDNYSKDNISDNLLFLNCPLHLILINENNNILDSNNRDRKLLDVYTNKISLEKLEEILSK